MNSFSHLLRGFALGLVWMLVPYLLAAQQAQPSVPPGANQIQQKILAGARAEASLQTPYIMEYQVLTYPGGDVPAGTGVCTDLVIRAFRQAGIDLQQRLHEDRVAHPEVYPTRLWDYKKPDRNIDHRRCQNLVVWFKRHARSLTTELDAPNLAKWQPGDVVFFVQPGADHPWHVAIVSDQKAPDGMPLIIDSYPPYTSQTHRLDTWVPIHSHFRYDGSQADDKARRDASARAARQRNRRAP